MVCLPAQPRHSLICIGCPRGAERSPGHLFCEPAQSTDLGGDLLQGACGQPRGLTHWSAALNIVDGLEPLICNKILLWLMVGYLHLSCVFTIHVNRGFSEKCVPQVHSEGTVIAGEMSCRRYPWAPVFRVLFPLGNNLMFISFG